METSTRSRVRVDRVVDEVGDGAREVVADVAQATPSGARPTAAARCSGRSCGDRLLSRLVAVRAARAGRVPTRPVAQRACSGQSAAVRVLRPADLASEVEQRAIERPGPGPASPRAGAGPAAAESGASRRLPAEPARPRARSSGRRAPAGGRSRRSASPGRRSRRRRAAPGAPSRHRAPRRRSSRRDHSATRTSSDARSLMPMLVSASSGSLVRQQGRRASARPPADVAKSCSASCRRARVSSSSAGEHEPGISAPTPRRRPERRCARASPSAAGGNARRSRQA